MDIINCFEDHLCRKSSFVQVLCVLCLMASAETTIGQSAPVDSMYQERYESSTDEWVTDYKTIYNYARDEPKETIKIYYLVDARWALYREEEKLYNSDCLIESHVIFNTRDALNKVISRIILYEYDTARRLKSERQFAYNTLEGDQGVRKLYEFNAAGQLITTTHQSINSLMDEDGTDVYQSNYSYDVDGLLTERLDLRLSNKGEPTNGSKYTFLYKNGLNSSRTWYLWSEDNQAHRPYKFREHVYDDRGYQIESAYSHYNSDGLSTFVQSNDIRTFDPVGRQISSVVSLFNRGTGQWSPRYRYRYFYGDGSIPCQEDELIESPSKVIYPNPSDGRFTIATDLLIYAAIYDMAGRMVRSYNLPATNTIDLSDLPSGAYVITYEDQDNRLSQRVIKL